MVPGLTQASDVSPSYKIRTGERDQLLRKAGIAV